MMITPENIEMWKKDPAQWDYDRGYHEEFNEELLSRLVDYNYKKVNEDLRMLAEVSDEDVPEYSEDDWKQAMYLLEHLKTICKD